MPFISGVKCCNRKTPRATENWEVCGSIVPGGEGKRLSLTATPLNCCAVSPPSHQGKFSLPADSRHLPDDYQPAVSTPWKLNILSDPKGCLWGGQLEDPWEENLYFATWLLFPNLVEILEDNIQLIILSSFFFFFTLLLLGYTLPTATEAEGVTNGIRKPRVPRKSAEGSKLTRGERKKWKENAISSGFGPRAPPGMCQFIHPEIWEIPDGNISICFYYLFTSLGFFSG